MSAEVREGRTTKRVASNDKNIGSYPFFSRVVSLRHGIVWLLLVPVKKVRLNKMFTSRKRQEEEEEKKYG